MFNDFFFCFPLLWRGINRLTDELLVRVSETNDFAPFDEGV